MEFPCDPPCVRKFMSAAALAQHKSNAPRHSQGGPSLNGHQPANGTVNVADAATVNGNSIVDAASELHGAQGVSILATANNVNGNTNSPRSNGTNRPEKKKGKEKKPRCFPCDRPFATKQALADHVRDSSNHGATAQGQQQKQQQRQKRQQRQQPQHTPLDLFFRSYASFPYDRSTPPADSFRQLARHFGWEGGRDNPANRRAWAAYQEALVAEVYVWFGNEDDIHAWRQLCRAVGMRDPPWTQRACAQTLRRTHVNIVDLIEWGRSGRPADNPVTVYRTVEELRVYTMREGKVFPQHEVQRDDGETNIVLRHLLRDFRRRPGDGGRR